ncbi:MAG: SLC13 family permease [Candidatus Kuenenia sp.]|nr:SLC13 family permease [Candidatus Kuenenia hertensis]
MRAVIMSYEQYAVFAILTGTFALFVWGRYRYDIVAMLALLAAVITGTVTLPEAFNGFGHPATITVAAVLIISKALSNSRAVDLMSKYLTPGTKYTTLYIAVFASISAALSAVMNNIAALALLMPVALESAEKTKRSTASILMPVSFGSILGGMVTLIGTPPNIVIAAYRTNVAGTPFRMFDFAPVGGLVTLTGIAFIAVLGWHLIPKQRRARMSYHDLFNIEDYVAEAQIPEGSGAAGKSLGELNKVADEYDANIVGIIRNERRIFAAGGREKVQEGDLLIIEAGPKEIDNVVAKLGLSLVGTDVSKTSLLKSEDVTVVEIVVTPGSRIEGQTPDSLRFKRRQKLNLLAVSRQGRSYLKRLKAFRFKAGDVLLVQGEVDQLPETIASLGCLPLAERKLQLGTQNKAMVSIMIFAAAIITAIIGILPLQITLIMAAVAMVMLNIVPVRDVYEAIDWSLIVLLGAMIPIGGALEATGATQLIVNGILGFASGGSPVMMLLVVMIITMMLSDVLNNTATAVVMAPISAGIALKLNVSADPFLMAVAVGASCAFLTPIGHQNNTMIMGPGGYKFGDYWRMGLPLEIIIIAVSIPLILWIWPL